MRVLKEKEKRLKSFLKSRNIDEKK